MLGVCFFGVALKKQTPFTSGQIGRDLHLDIAESQITSYPFVSEFLPKCHAK